MREQSRPLAAGQDCIPPDELRRRFSLALSAMYRSEVPAYGTLLSLVSEVNQAVLGHPVDARLGEERHGAIRVGTAEELSWLRRLFALFGMWPVGYYDLSAAGLPVHSTAFRPVSREALGHNAFRMFTSLLRLDLLDDASLRTSAQDLLADRNIFSPGLRALIVGGERDGGFDSAGAEALLAAALELFRWHGEARASQEVYRRLLQVHGLVADVVCFRGPHLNHLTPRTLDIDAVQARMPGLGLVVKDEIEGPPARQCPILLRQTAFRALQEAIRFRDADGRAVPGLHTARFGEVEQRGAALTAAGRARYDRLLQASRQSRKGQGPASAASRARTLAECFQDFPDRWDVLHEQDLAYFEYRIADPDAAMRAARGLTHAGALARCRPGPAPQASAAAGERSGEGQLADWLAQGWVRAEPIGYEDFLPVSAAGIFRSNLAVEATASFAGHPSQAVFEQALGAPVVDEQSLYARIRQSSLDACRAVLCPSGDPA